MRSQFSTRRRENHALGVTLGRYSLYLLLHTKSRTETGGSCRSQVQVPVLLIYKQAKQCPLALNQAKTSSRMQGDTVQFVSIPGATQLSFIRRGGSALTL